jgi:hypothetical protein
MERGHRRVGFLRVFQRDLHQTDVERQAHLDALEKREVARGYAGIFNFLYAGLSILDDKASSLLTFNAIGLTALAVWLEKIPLNAFHLTLDIAFLLFLISCGLCLKIVSLHWASTSDLNNKDSHPVHLLAVRDSRTVLYRWARCLAVLAVFVMGLAAIHHTFETLFTIFYRWKLNVPVDAATSGSLGF